MNESQRILSKKAWKGHGFLQTENIKILGGITLFEFLLCETNKIQRFQWGNNIEKHYNYFYERGYLTFDSNLNDWSILLYTI